MPKTLRIDLPPELMDRLLTVGEVQQLLAVSRSKVYQLVEAGLFPHLRIRGSIRIRQGALEEYLKQCEVG